MTENTPRPLRSWLFTPATRPERSAKPPCRGGRPHPRSRDSWLRRQGRAGRGAVIWKRRAGRLAHALRLNGAHTGAGVATSAHFLIRGC